MRVTQRMRELLGPRRLLRTITPITNTSGESWDDPEYYEAHHFNATLVTSEVDGEPGWHMPVIDIDLPCLLTESSKPGHHHLFINKKITWGQYLNILQALTDAGIVQEGYNFHTRRRGYGTVRYPGVTKDNEAQRIGKQQARALAEIMADL